MPCKVALYPRMTINRFGLILWAIVAAQTVLCAVSPTHASRIIDTCVLLAVILWGWFAVWLIVHRREMDSSRPGAPAIVILDGDDHLRR